MEKRLEAFFTGYCCWSVGDHHWKEASFKKEEENSSELCPLKILREARDERSFLALTVQCCSLSIFQIRRT